MKAWALLVLVPVLAACTAAAPPAAPPTPTTAPPVHVRLAYSVLNGESALLRLGDEQGIFKRNGIDVELQYLGGGDRVVAALLGGSVEAVMGGGGALLNAAASGAQLTLAACPETTVVLYIFARPGIGSLAELRGKTVGVTARSTLSDYALGVLARRQGLQLDQDIKLLPMGGQPQVLAGMDAGVVDAGAFSPPNDQLARSKGYAQVIDFTRENIPTASACLMLQKSYLASNRPTVVGLVKSLVEIVAYAGSHKEETIATILRHTQTDDAAGAAMAYQAYVPSAVSRRKPLVPPEALALMIDDAKLYNPKIEGLEPSTLYDNSVVDELDRSGFIDAAFSGLPG